MTSESSSHAKCRPSTAARLNHPPFRVLQTCQPNGDGGGERLGYVWRREKFLDQEGHPVGSREDPVELVGTDRGPAGSNHLRHLGGLQRGEREQRRRSCGLFSARSRS